MREDRLDHLRVDAQDRVQGHHGILEDHRDTAAPEPAHLPVRQSGDVGQMVRDPAVARVDPGHGPAELLVYFSSGTYSETFAANWAFLTERWYLAIYEGRFFKLVGMFLLGFWVGRSGILHDADQRSLLRRVLLWGLLIGVPATVFLLNLADGVALRPPSAAGWRVSSLDAVGVPALCRHN